MTSVLLVGCGHLGQALLKGWLDASNLLDTKFCVVDYHPISDDFLSDARVRFTDTAPEPSQQFSAIVYAVRPQQMFESLPPYARLAENAVNISVAAGWPIARLESHLGKVPLVRCMPNLPAQIGAGVTAAYSNAYCSDEQCDLTAKLLRAVGKFVWLEREDLLDVVTGLSGSGPAYIFRLVQAMAEAGRRLGLPEDVATMLARQTAFGAARYMEQNNRSALDLCASVSSPGGTTEAALRVLEAGHNIDNVMYEAIRAAKLRSEELGR